MFRNIIKKLNNFKFTAMLMAIISGVAGVYALASFFIYHFAGDPDESVDGLSRIVGFSSTETEPYLGMVLFFMALFTLGISIFIVYSLVPYLRNKEKLTPKKPLLLVGAIGAVFELVLFILMIVLLAKNPPHASHTVDVVWKVLLIVSLPFGLASIVGTGLYLIPFLKCDFYMPPIKK